MVGEPGAIDSIERRDLDAMINTLNMQLDNKTDNMVVEVGTWKGNSARELSKFGHVYCVDNWTGAGGIRTAADVARGDVFTEFRGYMKDIWHLIHPLYMDSADAVKIFPDNFLDICYIDANHDYEYVLFDLQNWYEKVKIGGIFCGHDLDGGHPGVVRAIAEVFGKVSDKVQHVSGTRFWWLKKTGHDKVELQSK